MEADDVKSEYKVQSQARVDYQYTVDGARDFFANNDIYHHFAEKASNVIAKNPRKKLHVFTFTHYGDDTFLCAVINDGGQKFHLKDVAFIDLKEYTERNGNAYKLTDQIEGMYTKYGKERVARYFSGASSDVRGRFFSLDRGRGSGSAAQSENERGEGPRLDQTGRVAGERNQRGGLPEGTGEVTSPDGVEVDEANGSAYKTQSSARTWYESDYVTKR